MLHLYVRGPKALDALLQKLQRQLWLLHCQSFADRVNEDCVVGGNTQPCSEISDNLIVVSNVLIHDIKQSRLIVLLVWIDFALIIQTCSFK